MLLFFFASLLPLFVVHELKKLFRIGKSVMDGTATRRKMGAVHENWKCFFLSTRFTEAYQARRAVLDEEERRREHGFALTQALTAVQEARKDVRTYFAGVADAFARFKSVDEAVQALECAGSDVRWYANLTRLCERWITCEEALIKNLEAAQELIPLVSPCDDTQALIVFKEHFMMDPTLPFPDPVDLDVSISQAHTRLKELGAIDVAQVATINDHLEFLILLLRVYGFPFENLRKI